MDYLAKDMCIAREPLGSLGLEHFKEFGIAIRYHFLPDLRLLQL